MSIFPHRIFITTKGVEAVENDRELLECVSGGGLVDWNKVEANQTKVPTALQVVDEVLSRPCPIRFGDTVPSSSGFIFGKLDAVLTDVQKRLYLVLIERTRWKDNLGQERFVSPFSIEADETPSVEANEIWANLDALCKVNLLARDDNGAYNFTLPGIAISNYSILREYYEGDGRAKLSPNLSYKRVVLPSIPVNAKSFVQLLKSIQRRLYEAQTGEPLQFQDKETHDYESITRITYSLQAPHFLIDPAISFEIIPFGPARVKVIAECYHGLAEESYNAALVEIGETWPEDVGSIITQVLGNMPQEEAKETTAEAQPWGMIPDYRWDRVAVKGLWEGLTDAEIAVTLADVDAAKTITNRLSLLRKQFPDCVPTRDALRKRRDQRKLG